MARYAACWRRAAAVNAGSGVDGSRSACSSATRSSATCAGSDEILGCAPAAVVAAPGDVVSSIVWAGTVSGAATVGDRDIGGPLCVQPRSAHMLVATTSNACRRAMFTIIYQGRPSLADFGQRFRDSTTPPAGDRQAVLLGTPGGE